MRNTEERVAAVKQRERELKKQKAMHRRRIVGISSTAACLLLIVGLSLVMPGIIARFPNSQTIFYGMTASVFHTNGRLGYILIGLLAFALGVCVTIFFYRLHRLDQEEKDRQKEQEDGNDRAD